MTAALPLLPGSLFAVRDVSAHYGEPAFDILFRDPEHRVVRCSDKLWACAAQAEAEAFAMELRGYRPQHWGCLEP